MADSRQSIFTAAKSAGYVNPKAENFYKPGSWQHKAWADGLQAASEAALALAPVAKTINEVDHFESAAHSGSKEMRAMPERLSTPPPPVIEHIRCLRADADNCGNVQRAERLRNKATKLAHHYSAY